MDNLKNDRKSLIRRFVKDYFELIPQTKIQTQTKKILAKLDFEISKAKTIAVYYPTKYEVNILPLMKRYKNFCFPVIERNSLKFYQTVFNKNFFKKNKFGIFEPIAEKSKRLDYSDIDVIFVPGVAFEKSGWRIGHGGGYFDRTLKKLKCKKIGVCFNFQIFETLPHSRLDIKLDKLVSA